MIPNIPGSPFHTSANLTVNGNCRVIAPSLAPFPLVFSGSFSQAEKNGLWEVEIACVTFLL